MLHRLFIFIMIVYLLAFFWEGGGNHARVLGASIYPYTNQVYLDAKDEDFSYPRVAHHPQIKTLTAFEQKELVEEEPIAYETVYEDDQDLEYGLEETRTPGILGKNALTYLVTHWGEMEIDRVLLSSETTPPQTEVIAKGKKISWKKLSTPDLGEIKYWAKMEVWATKYDSTCLGCNNTTALGAPVQQGVCAVDPKVIDMYTHFYVPGYGKCQALDVGGAIKGNKIDLAYEDVQVAPWRTGYVEIYLMDNEPE